MRHRSLLLAIAAVPAAAIATDDSCVVAVVGAGWAGIYSAFRLVVDSQLIAPTDVCLFEARTEAGGRTYSVELDPTGESVTPLLGSGGEGDGIIIDVGAYRFGKRMHLPGDLITLRLGLNISCYEPDCQPDAMENQTLYKVVDENGNAAGYGTPLKVMLSQLQTAGVRFYPSHELVALRATKGTGATLRFANSVEVAAGSVVLNLPRPVVQRLEAATVFGGGTLGDKLLTNCTPCDGPPVPVPAASILLLKVYAVYADPWWLTKLGIKQGLLNADDSTPPFVGRYHDGPIRKAADGTVLGPGALEVVYTLNLLHPSIAWYEQFRSNRTEPLTISSDAALLGAVHARLMQIHAPNFTAVGIDPATVAAPLRVVMGSWDGSNTLLSNPLSANFHAQPKVGLRCPAETCLKDVDGSTYANSVIAPTSATAVASVNNDFTFTGYQNTPCCWAEQSLKSAEKMLHERYGLPRPGWLDEDYYNSNIL